MGTSVGVKNRDGMERESSILGANSAFQMVLGGRKEEQQELEDCT